MSVALLWLQTLTSDLSPVYISIICICRAYFSSRWLTAGSSVDSTSVCWSWHCRFFQLEIPSQRFPDRPSRLLCRQMATRQQRTGTSDCLRLVEFFQTSLTEAPYTSPTPSQTPSASDSLHGAASERLMTLPFGSAWSSNHGEENDSYAERLFRDTQIAEYRHSPTTLRENFIRGVESVEFNNGHS